MTITITATTHSVETDTEDSIEYWLRTWDSDGIYWKSNDKHFRKLGNNNFWEERPNTWWSECGEQATGFPKYVVLSMWSECGEPVQEVVFQEWLRNQNNPKHGVWLYEQAIKEARESDLILDEE